MHSITITYSYNQKNIMETSKELVNLNTNRERREKVVYIWNLFVNKSRLAINNIDRLLGIILATFVFV